jgi:cytosine/adenosine deaminase-related metal-dependent hydrolase
MLLRARIVLPIARPPIEDGAVLIAGSRIVAVGAWPELAAASGNRVVDLGESILLPGLVNAHCHLDYTDMAGKIPPPRNFTDWIKAIVALKAHWSYTEFAQSWLRGAKMLLRTGTTTVADIETVPELIPEMWRATPLRVISFRELISLKSPLAAREIVEKAAREWSGLPAAGGRVGLSPHAPYTTSAELLRFAARAAREQRWPLTIHLAESEPEFEMFMYRHGALYEWLKGQREMSDCGLGSPVAHLDRCDCLGENLLAAHVNYLWRDDAALLGRRRVSVAHCPRSHAYFRHLLFPRAELAAAAVNMTLGTDSLASTLKQRGRLPELNMFEEMRALAAVTPDLAPGAILKMATANGARALGRQGELGELAPNALADLIVIPYAGKMSEANETVIQHPGDVSASMIDGQWAIPPE